jgi:hypothetical protein
MKQNSVSIAHLGQTIAPLATGVPVDWEHLDGFLLSEAVLSLAVHAFLEMLGQSRSLRAHIGLPPQLSPYIPRPRR